MFPNPSMELKSVPMSPLTPLPPQQRRDSTTQQSVEASNEGQNVGTQLRYTVDGGSDDDEESNDFATVEARRLAKGKQRAYDTSNTWEGTPVLHGLLRSDKELLLKSLDNSVNILSNDKVKSDLTCKG
jgi:hypothetical protein